MQTIRFTLLGAFDEEAPEFAVQMKRLQKSTPTLVSSLLTAKQEANIDSAYTGDVADESLRAKFFGTDDHLEVTARGRLLPTLCKTQYGLPLNEKEMRTEFKNGLLRAYREDYKSNVVLISGVQVVRWWKKLHFTDR